MSDSLWKALLVEFLGTFTLVFVGASAVALTLQQGGSLLTSAIAFGLALMAIIYLWGSYSGAHVNPAVSFGFAVAGQMNWGLMLGYWVAQILGGIAAGALVAYFFGTANGAGASVGSLTNTDPWRAVLMEAFITFFLVIAYLFIYRDPLLAIIAGVVIGAVLAFSTITGGALTGGSTNPARSLGPALFTNNIGTYWIYIVGPLIGALIAALVYKLFTYDFNCCYKIDDCGKKVVDECGNCYKVCKRPVLDNCGKQVMDCDKPVMEEFSCIEQKYGHTQEQSVKKVNEWLIINKVEDHYPKTQEIKETLKETIQVTSTPAGEQITQVTQISTTEVPKPNGYKSIPLAGNLIGNKTSGYMTPYQIPK